MIVDDLKTMCLKLFKFQLEEKSLEIMVVKLRYRRMLVFLFPPASAAPVGKCPLPPLMCCGHLWDSLRSLPYNLQELLNPLSCYRIAGVFHSPLRIHQ